MISNGRVALLFHTLFVVFMLAPLVVVVWVSFTPASILSLPTTEFSLRWFWAILEDRQFTGAFGRSLLLGLIASSFAVLLAVPAAFALHRFNFRGRGFLVGFFLSPLVIPHVVLGVAFLRFFSQAGLSGSFFALSGAHVLIIFPYALRLVLAAMASMNPLLERAAYSLGASHTDVVRRVLLPAILPGIAGGWIISFIQSFDEVTMTVFIASPSQITLPVRMYHYIEESIDPLVASVSTVVIVGTFILMLVVDRIYGIDRLLVGHGR